MTTAIEPTGRAPTVQSAVLLFEQLRRQGYEEGELRRIRLAYDAARSLFAGRVHASGKPYVAHCVAAASAAAGCAASADLVVAALLHGAYRWGDFGAWRQSLALRRAWLRRQVGTRAEEYIAGFDALPWNPDSIRRLSGRLAELDPVARSSVLLRLASDLDNIREHALHYCADAEKRLEALRTKGPALIGLAEELGLPALRDALAAAVEESEGSVPADLRWLHPTGMLLPPESSRLRPEAALAQATAALARRMRRLLYP